MVRDGAGGGSNVPSIPELEAGFPPRYGAWLNLVRPGHAGVLFRDLRRGLEHLRRSVFIRQVLRSIGRVVRDCAVRRRGMVFHQGQPKDRDLLVGGRKIKNRLIFA